MPQSPHSLFLPTPKQRTHQSISMHRTSVRPAPLEFLPPSNLPYGIDRRKDVGLSHPLSQLTPGYFAPLRDGLRTPPTDNMGTAYQYQHPQRNCFADRQDAAYSAGTQSASSYGGNHAGGDVSGAQRSNVSQPPPASTSTLRAEVQASSSAYNTQPSSPQPATKTDVLAPPEGLPQRRNANSDMIIPNLQIPSSINDSGGSLAEFAAQVGIEFLQVVNKSLTGEDYLPVLVRVYGNTP